LKEESNATGYII